MATTILSKPQDVKGTPSGGSAELAFVASLNAFIVYLRTVCVAFDAELGTTTYTANMDAATACALVKNRQLTFPTNP